MHDVHDGSVDASVDRDLCLYFSSTFDPSNPPDTFTIQQ